MTEKNNYYETLTVNPAKTSLTVLITAKKTPKKQFFIVLNLDFLYNKASISGFVGTGSSQQNIVL